MVIEINGKEYELKFGFGFLKEISKREEFTTKVEVNQDGVDAKVDTGLKRLKTGVSKLRAKDAITLVATIHCALSHTRHRLTEEDIFQYINTLIDVETGDATEYELLIEEIIESIKKVPTALVELAE